MRNTAVTNALQWLLATWILLATSVTPYWAHDHNSGDFANQHNGAGCTRLCSYSPIAYRGDHNENAGLCDDCLNHGFPGLPGSEKCLPSPKQSTIPHEGTRCCWCAWLRTVSAAQGIRISPKELTLGQLWLGDLSSTSIGDLESNLRGVFCSNAARSFPLCDRARHERSGVQLI